MSESKFHLCFVAPYAYEYLDPGHEGHPGGAERQQYLIGRRLRDDGHDVSFIVNEQVGNDGQNFRGFEVRSVIPQPATLKNAPSILTSVFRSAKSIDADLYYTRGTQKLCALTGIICSLIGKPYVYHVANDADVNDERYSKYPLPVRLAFAATLRRATAVISQKTSQQDYLRENFDVDSTTIPNVYTIPDLTGVPDHADRSFFLWVGRLDRQQKQPEEFLKIANAVPDQSFVLIGKSHDEEYQAYIRDRVASISNMRYEPYVSPDEIDNYYQNAISLVNTSKFEGFPNTFLEAWRYRTPVISLNPVLDGLIESEGVGFAELTIEDAADLLQMLGEDTAEAEERGINGRQYVQRHHSLDNTIADYKTVFDRAIQN